MVSGSVLCPFHVLRELGWDASVCVNIMFRVFLRVSEDWSECSVKVLKRKIIGPIDGR